jgi:predicted ATP-dependent endonuclease of OLD family
MKKITLTNFRKVKETWELELAPITYFVGPNNSGKSSILKALMLLDDYGNSTDHFTLKFNKEHSNNHKIDCYSNAINRYNLSKKNFDLEFKIENELYSIEFCFFPYEYVGEKFEKGKLKSLKFNSNIDNSFLSINHIAANEYQVELDTNFYYKTRVNDEIFEDVKSYEAMLFTTLQNIEQKNKDLINLNNLKERITLKNEVEDLSKFTKKLKDKIKDLNNRLSRNNHILQPKINLGEFDSFRNLDRVLLRALSFYINDDKTNKGYTNKKSEMQKITNMLESISDSLKLNLSHLSPNRNTQTRLYVNGEKSNDIYSIINEYYEYPILKKSQADEFLKYWMAKFDIGEDYKITPIHGLATIIEINEVSNNDNSWINLVDKGFGAGQIFSILLRIATFINKIELQNNSKSKTKEAYLSLKEKLILLIEEPEANLHPKFQSLLAEMFYQAAITFGLQFIIETHSEYMIRSSQLIHLNQVNKEKNVFSIYYFDKEGPYKMNMLDNGKFDRNFGEGFYDEASKNTMALIQKQKRQD